MPSASFLTEVFEFALRVGWIGDKGRAGLRGRIKRKKAAVKKRILLKSCASEEEGKDPLTSEIYP